MLLAGSPLWEEPNTIMHKITKVTIQLKFGTSITREVTTYTCSGNQYGLAEAVAFLRAKGYIVSKVSLLLLVAAV